MRNPENIVIKSEFFKEGLREIDVAEYYKKYKDFIYPLIKNKEIGLFIATDLDDKNFTVFKRYKAISNSDYDILIANGRVLEIHCELTNIDGLIDNLFIDVDPKEEVSFEETKKLVFDLVNYLKEIEEIKDISVNFSGGDGFHINNLILPGNPDAVREFGKYLLQEFIKLPINKDRNLTLGIAEDKNTTRLDLSSIKSRGMKRVLYSLHRETGLSCVEVHNILQFNIESALLIEKAKLNLISSVGTNIDNLERMIVDLPLEFKNKSIAELTDLKSLVNIEYSKPKPDTLFIEFILQNKNEPLTSVIQFAKDHKHLIHNQESLTKVYNFLFNIIRPEFMKSREVKEYKELFWDTNNLFSKSALNHLDFFSEGQTGRYVIHRHFAKKAGKHFDVRFEVPNGEFSEYKKMRDTKQSGEPPAVDSEKGLLSFAVRNLDLLSENKKNKVLAIPTEMHPLAYLSFEGEIKEGYGEGLIDIVDKGIYKVVSTDKNKVTLKLYTDDIIENLNIIKFKDNFLFTR